MLKNVYSIEQIQWQWKYNSTSSFFWIILFINFLFSEGYPWLNDEIARTIRLKSSDPAPQAKVFKNGYDDAV